MDYLQDLKAKFERRLEKIRERMHSECVRIGNLNIDSHKVKSASKLVIEIREAFLIAS